MATVLPIQLMKSLKYIHSAGIIHRDIKPANVLLSEACDLKLCDFGLARGRESADSDVVAEATSTAAGDLPPPKALKRALTKHVVTRWYRAPELPLYNDGKYEFSIDIWAAGTGFVKKLKCCASFSGIILMCYDRLCDGGDVGYDISWP